MSSRAELDYNAINFDDFHTYPSKIRKKIINDTDLLKIMVRKVTSEHRYLHSLSVAQTAAELAISHHVDVNKAYTAGLLHDVTKGFDEKWQDEYLRYYDPDKLDHPFPVKHSYTAKYYLREKLNLHDSQILNAVYNHTICTSRNKLAVILYIADKREPGRGLDDEFLELAHKDLYGAYRALSADVESYLRKRGTDERIIKTGL